MVLVETKRRRTAGRVRKRIDVGEFWVRGGQRLTVDHQMTHRNRPVARRALNIVILFDGKCFAAKPDESLDVK